jgi:hypothetical protein
LNPRGIERQVIMPSLSCVADSGCLNASCPAGNQRGSHNSLTGGSGVYRQRAPPSQQGCPASQHSASGWQQDSPPAQHADAEATLEAALLDAQQVVA